MGVADVVGAVSESDEVARERALRAERHEHAQRQKLEAERAEAEAQQHAREQQEREQREREQRERDAAAQLEHAQRVEAEEVSEPQFLFVRCSYVLFVERTGTRTGAGARGARA